jgi:hypothetical protein
VLRWRFVVSALTRSLDIEQEVGSRASERLED